jgi:nucleotide-binding universal stress UspA family protein
MATMYSKILAPLDGSKISESSLKHVQNIALGCQATEIVLLTIIEPLTTQLSESLYSSALEQVPQLIQKEHARMQQKAEDYLDEIAAALMKEGLAVKTVVIKPEANHGAADIIIDYARNNKIDLIIMSSHGRSGISRWTLGSVTDKIIRHAGVPVLTAVPEELKH